MGYDQNCLLTAPNPWQCLAASVKAVTVRPPHSSGTHHSSYLLSRGTEQHGHFVSVQHQPGIIAGWRHMSLGGGVPFPVDGAAHMRLQQMKHLNNPLRIRFVDDVLSQTYGGPGLPGKVDVVYLKGLRRGHKLDVKVGSPGKGGVGGLAKEPADGAEASFIDRGGAGGGRENSPIIDALKAYAAQRKNTVKEPLCFLEPGTYTVEWPYDISTATVVAIGPGGGGGGGIGDTLPGEDGEDGLPGATFIFPTYVPVQRPRE